MIRRIAVRGIFVKDGKLLCVKLKPYASSITGEFWCTIGGGVDEGEPLLQAVGREVIEETGIAPQVGSLLYIQQFKTVNNDQEKEHIEFFFNILNVDDYMQIDLSKSSHGEAEIAEIEFIDPKKHVLFPKFLSDVDFTKFDPNMSTQFYNYM